MTITTTQAARIMQVSPKTVVRWVDEGLLRGWRVPGSGGHRRIELANLRKFMEDHGMPLDKLREFEESIR